MTYKIVRGGNLLSKKKKSDFEKSERDLSKETYEGNDKPESSKEMYLLIASSVLFPFQHATSKIYKKEKRAQMQKRKLRIRLMVD